MEALEQIDPMTWIIIAAAAVISVAVLFNKAIKFALKIAAIMVCLIFVLYFLVQAGVVTLPSTGK